jgi:hypothetical protein
MPAHEYLGPKALLAAIVWYRYHNSHPPDSARLLISIATQFIACG